MKTAEFYILAYSKFKQSQLTKDACNCDFIEYSGISIDPSSPASSRYSVLIDSVNGILAELINEAHIVREAVSTYELWRPILLENDRDSQMYLFWEFIEPHLILGLLEPSGIRNRMINLILRFLMALDSQGVRNEIPSDEEISYSLFDRALVRCELAAEFRRAVQLVNSGIFTKESENFRNCFSHRRIPYIHIGLSTRIDFTPHETVHGFHPPLDVNKIVDALKNEYLRIAEAIAMLKHSFGLYLQLRANKSSEATPTAVTPAANAPGAPSAGVPRH